ncbi:MAG: hypothetical protein ABMA26_04830 [Limisphaerales bacterium]
MGFHPVFDNPIRMGYFPGWKTASDLVDRMGDLESAIGPRQVVPAQWEPYYRECPRFRFAGAYAWARSQAQSPLGFALALALFPGEADQITTGLGHANWLILAAQTEPSHITRELMVAEALGSWETHAGVWLEQIARTCAHIGVEVSVPSLRQQMLKALQPLREFKPGDDGDPVRSDYIETPGRSHGFDKQLLQLEGWTPDPGTIVLPVDGRTHVLAREILVLDLEKVVLRKAGRPVRTVPWEKVTLVHLVEGEVTLEIADQTSLVVAGYRQPEATARTIQECYRAASERLLQLLAKRMSRLTP